MNDRQLIRIRAEDRSQGHQVGQFVGVERSGKLLGQFTLATAIMSQGQQFDGDLASLPVRQLLEESVESPSIFRTGEELVAIDQVEKRHGLFAQRVDHVVIVDDLIVLATRVGATPRQRQ